MQVGDKVTVRFRIGGLGPSGGPAMSDVVGELVDMTDSTLVVRHRTGELRSVDRGAVVIVKVINRP